MNIKKLTFYRLTIFFQQCEKSYLLVVENITDPDLLLVLAFELVNFSDFLPAMNANYKSLKVPPHNKFP